MRHVIARVKDDLLASEITNKINVLQAIGWVTDAWREVSVETIKNCFAKCGITGHTTESEDDAVDEEFDALFNELNKDSECDMNAEEYVDFDVETSSSLPAINSDMIDWRKYSIQKCVAEYLRKQSGEDDLELISGSDDDADDGDAGEVEVDVEVEVGDALNMLDKLVNLKHLNKEERNSLFSIKEKLEKIKISNKKQSSINDYFKQR